MATKKNGLLADPMAPAEDQDELAKAAAPNTGVTVTSGLTQPKTLEERFKGITPARAITREVTPDETSQFQLDKMLSTDSPLRQRSEAYGKQVANSRGLLNSSISAGSAFGAMVDRSQPFALQDASTYSSVASGNQLYENQAEQLNARMKFDFDNREDEQAFKAAESTLDRELDRFKLGEQVKAPLYQGVMAGITSILQDPNLESGKKPEAIKNLIDQSINAAGSVQSFTSKLGGSTDSASSQGQSAVQAQGGNQALENRLYELNQMRSDLEEQIGQPVGGYAAAQAQNRDRVAQLKNELNSVNQNIATVKAQLGQPTFA